ncbi:MAG: TonB-dependent receptor [Chitinophagales bacterium]
MFFVRVPAFIGNAVKFGNLWAVFSQLDKKFGDKVTLSGGIRWEVYKYASDKGVIPPNSRFGINWKAGKNTNVRFNIGQAFRFPSFAERFVNEKLGEDITEVSVFDSTWSDTRDTVYITETISESSRPLLRIIPNVNLQPEYGWTSEIGFQQKFGTKNKNYSSLLDFAFYWQEYHDMVEFGAADSTTDALITLQANNISHARIAGWDMSFKNNFSFSEKHQLSLNFGYTYAFPVELNPTAFNPEFDNSTVGSYLKNMFKYFAKSVDGINIYQLLKYRNRHLATFDVEYNFNKKLLIGMDVRYYSKFENYDLVFLGITGVPEYLYNYVNPKGNWVANARIFYTFKEKNTLGVIVKNFTNTEYWLRVGRLEMPMNFTIQYRMEF